MGVHFFLNSHPFNDGELLLPDRTNRAPEEQFLTRSLEKMVDLITKLHSSLYIQVTPTLRTSACSAHDRWWKPIKF